MYGAILGDIVGSPYEFRNCIKTKVFPMFSPRSRFTDDTVMTVAVGEALLRAGRDADEKTIEAHIIEQMQRWGQRFPDAGYGGQFRWWLRAENPQPYNSFGNGSAMRVSAVGWLYDSLERTLDVAKATAQVTHNHPEGIKGAQAVAAAIYLARTGKTKEEIRNYTCRTFGYDLSRTCDEIRPTYFPRATCQETVPEAITAFLEGENFEDVIRTAVSLGGDCDTLTAIAVSIAEAYYGMPEELKTACMRRLPEEIKEVLQLFDVVRSFAGSAVSTARAAENNDRGDELAHKFSFDLIMSSTFTSWLYVHSVESMSKEFPKEAFITEEMWQEFVPRCKEMISALYPALKAEHISIRLKDHLGKVKCAPESVHCFEGEFRINFKTTFIKDDLPQPFDSFNIRVEDNVEVTLYKMGNYVYRNSPEATLSDYGVDEKKLVSASQKMIEFTTRSQNVVTAKKFRRERYSDGSGNFILDFVADE